MHSFTDRFLSQIDGETSEDVAEKGGHASRQRHHVLIAEDGMARTGRGGIVFDLRLKADSLALDPRPHSLTSIVRSWM